MTSTSAALKQIFTAARPLVEQWLDVGEQIAALRDAATAKGLDWSQLKALLKAQVQDERDGKGGGKRVRRIVEKAEFASAYADMLGLANMNEENFSSPPHDPETGEITEPPEVNHGHAVPVQAGEGGSIRIATECALPAATIPDLPPFLDRRHREAA